MRKKIAATGASSPEQVWELYRRPAAWSTWSPQIRSVECADETIKAGTTGKVVGLFGFTVDFVVTSVDEAARRWTWKVRAPLGIRMRLSHGVEPAPAGVRTTLEVDGPAPVVLAYLPVAGNAMRRLVRK